MVMGKASQIIENGAAWPGVDHRLAALAQRSGRRTRHRQGVNFRYIGTNTIRGDATVMARNEFPQLNLPRFSLRSADETPAAPAHYSPAPHSAPMHYAPAPMATQYFAPHHQMHAPAAPFEQRQYAAYVPAQASVPPLAPRMQPVYAAPAYAENRFNIQPIHMMIAIALVVCAWMVTQGSQMSLNIQAPATLPPLPAAKTETLALKKKPAVAGIPSPSAARSLELETTRAAGTKSAASIKFQGIPSPAAAASLDPTATLPLRPSDGMSLPRAGSERDSYATERHYGANPGDSAKQVEISEPLLTPAEAQQYAENRAGYDLATGNMSVDPNPQDMH